MDLRKVLHELYEEKKRLEEVIASLEALQHSQSLQKEEAKATHEGAGRRGRKNMGPEERLNVTQRMKKYWAARRKAQKEKDCL